eukprot:12398959-Karenia_brevis.AAC.1
MSDLGDRGLLARLRSTAFLIAQRATEYDMNASRRSWLTWLQEGPAQGLARQHRMSRVAGGWIPSPVGADQPNSADVEVVEGELDDVLEDECGHLQA